MLKLLLSGLLLSSVSVKAAVVAIVDSGVDVEHSELASQMWMNPVEMSEDGRDNDNNGFQDDIFGWNFAEDNNLVLDKKYLGSFSNDPYKFFELQGKAMTGRLSTEEEAWMEAKFEDEKFIKELSIFGNFIHGTHVAGIALKSAPNNKSLAVKLIPTEISLPAEGDQGMDLSFLNDLRVEVTPGEDTNSEEFKLKVLKTILAELAKASNKTLGEVTHYVKGHNVDVVNGSFGTGVEQISELVRPFFKAVMGRDATDAELMSLVVHFFDKSEAIQKEMFKGAPKVLFVFAAGNSGTNNDVVPTTPTNVKLDNTISVAATYKRAVLAPFSNYGAVKVDVAAPGMLIDSTIPGNERLAISGTSQAAPYVANVAAQVKDANPSLTPGEIKKIIMGTVDVKDFLAGKVASSGIVNLDRAVHAARLVSTSADINRAILVSKTEVRDVPSMVSKSVLRYNKVKAIKLPSYIKLK